MRLQPAKSMDEFGGFEGPEEREARRARRKARRAARKKRKLTRIQRKTRKLQQETRAPRRGKRKARKGAAAPSAASQAMPSQQQPWDQGGGEWEEPQLEPAPDAWPSEDPEALDAEWSEMDAAMEEELEGVGAFRPLQALQKVKPLQALRKRGQGRRTAAGWGPNVRMGKNLRIQAASGHRAAVIDLKPGLYLVAELPEAVARTEFGFAPLLAPLMIKAAKKAIDSGKKDPEKRGPLAALFQKQVEARRGKGPLRVFRAREAQPVAQADAPKQLTGPVAAPGLQPAQGAGTGRTFLLPAPNVGWADDQDVAEVLGCEACDAEWPR
jgi:hypothetical protein